jgi:hypothetical protein
MGYLHIPNLYKEQDILLFKECYALEKIHGTSAHISFKKELTPDQEANYTYQIGFFAGGENYEKFIKLFNQEELLSKFKEWDLPSLIIYGEAYGGKQQGMSDTYGKELKFVAFDVKINDNWLRVPQAEKIVLQLGLEFVDYVQIPTELNLINKYRDTDSVQAVRNGIGYGKKREGVVLRPLIEITQNNGERIIAKHKRDDFSETKTPRELNPDKLKILAEANSIAEEWVTPMRLSHILDKIKNLSIEKTGDVIEIMIEDVEREAKGEILESKDARKAISKKTALLFKEWLKGKIK